MTPVRPMADPAADPPPISTPCHKFHIVHVLHPTNHGPMGYREVVETLYWGLTQLGHEVSLGVNNYLPDRTNIFIGGQMLDPADLERFPAGSIFYHLEQIANVPPEALIPSAHIIASRFRIWEYNAANINTWRQLNPAFAPELLPICWAQFFAESKNCLRKILTFCSMANLPPPALPFSISFAAPAPNVFLPAAYTANPAIR